MLDSLYTRKIWFRQTFRNGYQNTVNYVVHRGRFNKLTPYWIVLVSQYLAHGLSKKFCSSVQQHYE